LGGDAAERAHDDAPLYAPGGETPPRAGAEVALAVPHPDNPPWGTLVAIGIVIASFILMLVFQLILIIPYALTLGTKDPARMMEVLQTDKNVILLSILAIIPAHLLTLLLCWLVVTGAGKRPFWRTLGWGWSPRLGMAELGAWLGLAVALLGVSFVSVKIFGDQETDLERWLMSSRAARYAIAALATFTAPVVEEVVYRGVLYSALRRRLGEAASVIFVLAVFAAIHVPQYKQSWAALTTIVILSLVLTVVRARTGRLLPCVAIHLFFNGITSIFIVLASEAGPVTPTPAPPAPTGALLHDSLSQILCLFT
jgi:membrane protease YdiL (CAAX protease family)